MTGHVITLASDGVRVEERFYEEDSAVIEAACTCGWSRQFPDPAPLLDVALAAAAHRAQGCQP